MHMRCAIKGHVFKPTYRESRRTGSRPATIARTGPVDLGGHRDVIVPCSRCGSEFPLVMVVDSPRQEEHALSDKLRKVTEIVAPAGWGA